MCRFDVTTLNLISNRVSKKSYHTLPNFLLSLFVWLYNIITFIIKLYFEKCFTHYIIF